MNTTSQLTTSIEPLKWLMLAIEDLCLVVNLDSAHGEMEHRLHQGNVESIIDVHRHIVEVFLGMFGICRVFLLALCDGIVVLEGFVQSRFATADLLGEL